MGLLRHNARTPQHILYVVQHAIRQFSSLARHRMGRAWYPYFHLCFKRPVPLHFRQSYLALPPGTAPNSFMCGPTTSHLYPLPLHLMHFFSILGSLTFLVCTPQSSPASLESHSSLPASFASRDVKPSARMWASRDADQSSDELIQTIRAHVGFPLDKGWGRGIHPHRWRT